MKFSNLSKRCFLTEYLKTFLLLIDWKVSILSTCSVCAGIELEYYLPVVYMRAGIKLVYYLPVVYMLVLN